MSETARRTARRNLGLYNLGSISLHQISSVVHHPEPPRLTRLHRRIFRVFLPHSLRLSHSGVSSHASSAQRGYSKIRHTPIVCIPSSSLASTTIISAHDSGLNDWRKRPMATPTSIAPSTVLISNNDNCSMTQESPCQLPAFVLPYFLCNLSVQI